MTSHQYGFTATPARTGWEPDAPYTGWRVYLPHQCDDWDIAGTAGNPTTPDEAAACLRRFITEAQEALAAVESDNPQSAYWDDGILIVERKPA